MAQPKSKPSYRLAAFAHWANLGLLATGTVAGAALGPEWWLALVPIEAAVLWAIPDLPPFRALVDDRERKRRIKREREFYLDQLFGLRPRPSKTMGERFRGLFVADEPDDADDRVVTRNVDCDRYLEMREIVEKLRAMVPLEDVRVNQNDIERLELVINGYLRLLFACNPLRSAIQASKREKLKDELEDVRQRLENGEPSVRSVLLERERLLTMQLERLPKLEASLELLRSRADALCYQVRNLHSQVVTDPGTQVHAALDEMIERNDMLADPLADLDADQMVRDLLAETKAPAPPARVSAPPQRRQNKQETRH